MRLGCTDELHQCLMNIRCHWWVISGWRSASGYILPVQTVVKIISEEGFHAPFKGLVPGLHRQFLFTGLQRSSHPALLRYMDFDRDLLHQCCA